MARSMRLLAIVALTGCSVLGPSTELQVENRTGATRLDVLAAQCNQTLTHFRSLADGETYTRQVEPGCWVVEAWTDDARMGRDSIDVVEGALNRVPFTRGDQ